jgi:Na+:H+ antiporter, NhaA family
MQAKETSVAMTIPGRSRGTLDVTRRHSMAVRALQLPVQRFIHTEGVGGWFLLATTMLALGWANSRWQELYFKLWQGDITFEWGRLHLYTNLHHVINDGLMAIFFFLVGMEIKHELVLGELKTARRAMLPVIAALGGMIVPAAIYFSMNRGSEAAHGWGIPMATDIAFALGVLAMIRGIPVQLKVFLLAVAIVDDIGAILVIAIFYSEAVHVLPLAFGGVLLLALWGLHKAEVQLDLPYVVLAIAFWAAVLASGVHATIAGVILGMMVESRPMFDRQDVLNEAPGVLETLEQSMRDGNEDKADAQLGILETLAQMTEAPLERLTRALHSWVAFIILPLFALANAGVVISKESLQLAMQSPVAWGVGIGLLLGKPLGIVGVTWLAVKLRLLELPQEFGWKLLAGTGVLAGIGFTVSIFITGLAFKDPNHESASKIAVLLISITAGAIGYFVLNAGVSTKPLESEVK